MKKNIEKKRPIFLSLICVIAFIIFTLMFLGNSVAFYSSLIEKIDYKTTFKSLFMALGSALCFIGLVYIWKVKNKGFKLYLFGTVLVFISLIIEYYDISNNITLLFKESDNQFHDSINESMANIDKKSQKKTIYYLFSFYSFLLALFTMNKKHLTN